MRLRVADAPEERRRRRDTREPGAERHGGAHEGRRGPGDAGLVYATDARGNTKVDAIVPPGADKVVNTYPIVALGSSPSAAAQAFVAFVLGPEGQAVLASYGFGAP